MTDLALLAAEDLLAGYRQGRFTPIDAFQAITERIARTNPACNAFAQLDPGALKAAGDSARRWHAGRPLGPLDGVPCTVTDLVDVAGLPTRRGSRTTASTPAAHDAPSVLGLRNAGAVILGKTTTTEFGWKAQGDCPLHGITRNPWNPGHTTGGASAGAGAAGAAGFGPLHVGTDAGGGLRIPAAWCGLVGFKPSAGRVPQWPPGSLAGAFASTAVAGPLTRIVRDAALMFGVMARHDWRDPMCLPDDPRDWLAGIEDGVAGLRVAVLRHPGFDAPLDADGVAAVEQAAAILHEAGAELEEVDPALPDTGAVFATLRVSAMRLLLSTATAEQRALMDPALILLADGAEPSGIAVMDAAAQQMQAAHAMARLHRDYDLVLCPTVPGPPPLADAAGPDTAMGNTAASWTMAFSLSRQPAISVPMGLAADGLPRSVQLAAALYRDDLVLRAARTVERAQPPLLAALHAPLHAGAPA